MSRKQRIKSETGIYHVMLRGNNGRVIFYDDEDYNYFLISLRKAKEKSSCEIYSYCLMNNHIHLLIKESSEEIGTIVRRITAGYVLWYNDKHARTGHLFQGRFRSEPVESDRYLLIVLRYILQNPVKAGIVTRPGDYAWSSYSYFFDSKEKNTLIDKNIIEAYFDKKTYIQYMNEKNNDQCLEYTPKIRYTDDQLIKAISEIKGLPSVENISASTEDIDNIIRIIKGTTGASNRQISRIIDVSRWKIDNIKL